MNEYLSWIIAALAAVASWYCYRWGHDDGRADGYEKGRQKGLLEGSGAHNDPVAPSLSGGPREPA